MMLDASGAPERRTAPTAWIGRMRLAMIVGNFVLATSALAQDVKRLDSWDLLRFHAADGSVQPVRDIGEWSERRAAIVRGMQHVMGDLPAADRNNTLNVRVLEEVDVGSYVRRLITYQADTGVPTPAYLCLPKGVVVGAAKAPAVLCLHPTDHQFGHQVVVGLGGKSPQPYAIELAERGFVTLAPAYPLMADYWPNLEQHKYQSGTMKAIWDNIRALDVLSSLPQVDSARGFGAIGHSLGGHNAIFTAVMDDRISIVVSSCGFDSFCDYYDGAEANWYFGKGWCQLRYMPRLSDYRGKLSDIPFDFPELIAALAPRSVFISAPLRDDNFRWRSVEACVAAARPVYALHGTQNRLTVVYPDCEHGFPADVRDQAYTAIEDVLRSGSK